MVQFFASQCIIGSHDCVLMKLLLCLTAVKYLLCNGWFY